jgi:4-diphosphocytidyl-2-C-methyl-D-erythritol kinase
MILSEAAPAKLNLFLNIVGRRDDGYHRLDSLFVFVGCADRLSFAADEDLVFEVAGPFAEGLDGQDNLVVKAARLLAAEAGLRPSGRLTLRKHMPVAAGVGGGSADAAATLRLLNRAWGLDWPEGRLVDLAGRLGADIPACVASRPVLARETGEALSPAPALPPCGILLVNPRLPTPTPAVFRLFRELNPIIAARPLPTLPQRFDDLAALVATIGPRGNDLLPAALRVTPAIGDVLAAMGSLPQVSHAGLSGSGATCFALFDTVALADGARRNITAATDWWCWSGGWFDGTAPGATLP